MAVGLFAGVLFARLSMRRGASKTAG
jgi:hypothetical protein